MCAGNDNNVCEDHPFNFFGCTEEAKKGVDSFDEVRGWGRVEVYTGDGKDNL
jgi:hypothetical protein